MIIINLNILNKSIQYAPCWTDTCPEKSDWWHKKYIDLNTPHYIGNVGELSTDNHYVHDTEHFNKIIDKNIYNIFIYIEDFSNFTPSGSENWLRIINMIAGCLDINRFPEVIKLEINNK